MSLRLGLRVVASLLLASILGACAGLGTASAPMAGSVDSYAATDSTADLRLAAGDKLRITVFGEDKLSGEYQIDNAGFVSLPLAGTIQAAGLTKPQLEESLTNKLKGEYLRNPRITVDVINFRPFYVLGEVQKPGEYQFRSGLNVLSAIAIAGGATYRASTSKILIQRAGTSEMQEYPQSPTVLIMPGDVVRLPERFF